MEMTSTVVVAYQWLKMAVKAKQALVTGDTTYESKFYENKIHTMKFYFKYVQLHLSAPLNAYHRSSQSI